MKVSRLGLVSSTPRSLLRKIEPYIDTEQEQLHKRLHKVLEDRSVIDFNHITQVFTRSRTEADTLKELRRTWQVAGLLKERDEFGERNLVVSHKDASNINYRIHYQYGFSEPYLVNIDQDEEVVKCIVEDVVLHKVYNDWIMYVVWNRFIPGRPNRMLMKVVPDDFEKSEARWRGGRIHIFDDMVWVDVHTETYPRVIKANIKDCVPGTKYKIGDLKKDLPDGITLAPKYAKSAGLPIFGFDTSIKSKIYFETMKNRIDATRFVDVDLTLKQMHKYVYPEETAASTKEQTIIISKAEEERMRKLAAHLGKDFETLKKEIIESRKQKEKPGTIKKK